MYFLLSRLTEKVECILALTGSEFNLHILYFYIATSGSLYSLPSPGLVSSVDFIFYDSILCCVWMIDRHWYGTAFWYSHFPPSSPHAHHPLSCLGLLFNFLSIILLLLLCSLLMYVLTPTIASGREEGEMKNHIENWTGSEWKRFLNRILFGPLVFPSQNSHQSNCIWEYDKQYWRRGRELNSSDWHRSSGTLAKVIRIFWLFKCWTNQTNFLFFHFCFFPPPLFLPHFFTIFLFLKFLKRQFFKRVSIRAQETQNNRKKSSLVAKTYRTAPKSGTWKRA